MLSGYYHGRVILGGVEQYGHRIPRHIVSWFPMMLELRHINKAYIDGRPVLSDLSYALNAGEYVAIMGDSGVGKSTLLNLIAGLDTPDSGEIGIDGTIISLLDDDAATQLRREKFGFIFQAFHVLPHLTLNQNIALPLLLNGNSMERVASMLAAVGLDDRGNSFPHELSGGELQRVAIARALVHRPKLILADEPTGNLDPDTAHDILMLIRAEIKANGAAGIIVTHSRAAAETADHVLTLTKDGLYPMVFNHVG
ncbi:putative ABC transport system ATP-binding protein [Nitrosomonas cryotolerans]|uniref:Putative ABC transport system ATP-binding protein n=2 Tax=Nitrosomonas cryotolerans TaxID=44575 RepID=A0A1N6GIM8_9PROT|nr:putative ABC transport system ATP-binding protein [Nitrosomonas cryotolerans]SIO07387.1 putative ABC transport system ATP-binding protein [Nitrosomonas cryotolerans ATCC 49181]